MKIVEITEDKKQYLDLLLLADEQETMIDRYLYKGKMYVLDDNGIKCECVVTDEGNGVLEIKNIATVPEYQGKGYAKALIDFIVERYGKQYAILQVGTGDSPLTIPFYEKCGFIRSHSVPHFFTDNYDHPIYEDGVQLVDMIYLRRRLLGGVNMIETERLILREYTMGDFAALYEIVSDPETMQHYPAPFDVERTKVWISWNLENYEKYGFGLWAVVLKETGEFIGDCGITIQNIDGEMLPEIGYHIHKKYWRKGFGKEAAIAVRDWTFEHTDYDIIYSYMKYTNVGSYNTAIANGMKRVKVYADSKNTISYAYAITKAEWEKLR